MELIEDIRKILEKSGYDLVTEESHKTLEQPKEIKVRSVSKDRVELEPHLFEGEDVKKHLKDFCVREHNPEVIPDEGRKGKNGHYYLIVERRQQYR